MTPENLREIRTRLGLTQEQMAEALGFAPTPGGRIHYTRMESGERSITVRTERLVRALEREDAQEGT